MLTKDDLRQIGQLMDERFSQQDKRIDERLAQQDKRIDKRFSQQDSKFDQKLKKAFKPIQQDLKDIKQTNEIMLRLIRHDNHHVQSLESRVSRIESHLKLSPASSN